MGARAGASADQDIQMEIFERRVKHLFHVGQQAVNFVDEENLAMHGCRSECRRGRTSSAVRARRFGEGNLELLRDDGRERGFAQAWRAIEQHVIHGLAAFARRVDGDLQILFEPACPVKSARRRGRRPASNWRSSSLPSAEIRRDLASSAGISGPAPGPCGTEARSHRAHRPPAPCGPQLRPPDVRNPDSAGRKAHLRRARKAPAARRICRLRRGRGQLIAQFQDDAFGRLLANAGNAYQPVDFAAPDGRQADPPHPSR